MTDPVAPGPSAPASAAEAPAVPPAELAKVGQPVVQADLDDFETLGRLAEQEQAKIDAARAADGESPGESPSEPAPEGESPAESPAEPEGSPVDRALAAAAKARAGAARNRELRHQQQMLARQNAMAQQRIQQLQVQAHQAQQQLERLAQDPIGVLEERGVSQEELIRRGMRRGTPEEKIDALTQIIQEERQARVALENRIIQEKQQIALRQGEVAFLQESLKESYPTLSVLPERTVLREAKEAVEDLTAQGYDLSDFPDSDLCAYIEHRLTSGKRRKAAPAAPEAAPAEGKKPLPKTLTNSLGTKRVQMPANFESLDQDEQFKHLGKIAESHRK